MQHTAANPQTARYQLSLTSLTVQITLMLVAAFLCLLPGVRQPLNIYDEGLIALGAERILDGQIPYRDFWTMYGPGQIYVLAGLFKLFGVSIMTERLYDLAIRSALAVALYLLAARLSSRQLGLVTWVMAVLWLAYFGFFGYPIFTALLFVTLSTLALIAAFTDRRWLLGGGMLIGVAAWFRHDLAVYAIVAQGVILIASAFARGATREATRSSVISRLWQAARTQAAYAVGLALVLAPVAVFFLATTPVNELLQQLLVFPLTVFPAQRVLPYPPFELTLESLPFYAPFLVYALALVVIVVSVRATQDEAARTRLWGIGLVALFGLFAFNQARVRADLIHIPQFFLPAVVLLPVLMHQISGVSHNVFAATGLAAFLLMSTLLIKPVDYFAKMMEGALNTPNALNHGIERAAGAQMMQDQAAAVRFVQFTVPPGQPIFSAVPRHDLIFINDPMFYFLADRSPATRYHELHPGLATTQAVQREIIAELERNDVQTIVIATHFEGVREPNASALSSGVKLLDEHIAGHYTIAQQIGGYQIMVKRR